MKLISYFVYVVECSDATYYTGCTNNLKRRLNQHNFSKKGAYYTKLRRPVKLIYTEEFETRRGALKREAQIKRLTRKQKEKLLQE